VTLTLVEALKGWVPERQIVIKQLGGRVGDLEQAVPGQATFARGEEMLLFLQVRASDLTLSTMALWQGKWSIRRNEDIIAVLYGVSSSSPPVPRRLRGSRHLADWGVAA
jgi:hypothetical protein